MGGVHSCQEATAGQHLGHFVDVVLVNMPYGGSLTGFNYTLHFDNTRLEIVAQWHNYLLAAEGNYNPSSMTEGVPDTDGAHSVAEEDSGDTEWSPEYTEGVLSRYVMRALDSAPPGAAPLTLTDVVLVDDDGAQWLPDLIRNAEIRVDDTCNGFTPTPTPPPWGDVNCDGVVDIVDALFVLQYDLGLRAWSNDCPPPEGTLYGPAGRVSCDPDVDIVDALFILQCDLGLRSCDFVCP